MKSKPKAQKPITRDGAIKRFKLIKITMDVEGLDTSTRMSLVAEVAAFRELGYLSVTEAAPYLK